MEFVLLLSFLMLIMVIFSLVIQKKMTSALEDKNREMVEEVNNLVVNEIRLASTVLDGYRREFTLPPNINGEPYKINISHSEIVLMYKDRERVTFLDEYVNGSLTLSEANKIQKINGVVWINRPA